MTRPPSPPLSIQEQEPETQPEDASPEGESEQDEDDTLDVPSLPHPLTPLVDSYTYSSPWPTEEGDYILGVDEAGRGPVLGPLVYGVAYCAESKMEDLEEMGFAGMNQESNTWLDSKVLTHDRRATLLSDLSRHPEYLGWSVQVISPQAISSNMLRHPATNLNQLSKDATVHLIRTVLAAGIKLSKIYVDALGPSVPYQAYLSGLFPTISITVETKADSKWKIVGAASVAAKVTRDAWIEQWQFAELKAGGTEDWDRAFGSGYPSDPNTKAWIQNNLERTFGFPSIARFSWGTVKNILDEPKYKIQWNDENQKGLVKSFETVAPIDKGRCMVAKDLCVHSVADL